MKNLTITILIASLAVISLISPMHAEIVTRDKALSVANNWITVMLHRKGTWGDANSAFVEDIQEFKRGERLLGYFCRVQPKGYIIVSLRKELAPVKACSATSDLDPTCEEGMADLIKDCMERIINRIEKEIGPISSVRTQDLSSILEIDYRSVWAELGTDIESFEKELTSGVITMNYQEGGILLSTSWRQGDPYNQDCPAPPGGDDCTDPHCLVGCVATAGAQIMRYWCWPPYGVGSPYNDTYDWTNMPDTVAPSSPAAQRNAVAELCHEIGIAVGMGYCKGDDCQSSASTEDMEGVYEGNYRYTSYCVKRIRSDYSPVEWFDRMAYQFNANQPVHYRIPGHSIVGDGWRIVSSTRQYHMNYGWGRQCGDPNGCNTWYTLDALHGGDKADEYLLENIHPDVAVGASLSPGMYFRNPSFPYRYFGRDTVGSSTAFQAGQYLQFLPNIKVRSTGTVRFYGTSTAESRLFNRGDTSRGIRIDNGGIDLYAGGSLILY